MDKEERDIKTATGDIMQRAGDIKRTKQFHFRRVVIPQTKLRFKVAFRQYAAGITNEI